MHRRLLIIIFLLAGCLAAAWYYAEWLDLASDSGGVAEDVSGPQPIAVSTVAARTADFPIRRRSIGLMESPAIVVLRSRIDSQILEQHVKDGQIVKKGDLLFTLDDREVRAALAQAEATLEKDLANKARADLDLDRVKQLLERNAAARQQLDQAVAEAKAAAATVANDRARVEMEKLRLSYTEIRAPIEGRIGTVRVTPGNLVSANDMSGTGLVTITQVRPIRVSFTVPEKDLALVRSAYWRKPPAPRATVRALQPMTGKILGTAPLSFIDSAVDTASGTLNAKAVFDNDGYVLVPGQYVDVEVELDMAPGMVIIPSVALQTGPNGSFVFAVNEESSIDVTPVTVLGTEGDVAAVESGLDPGTHVVVEGQLKLEQGTLVADNVMEPEWTAEAALAPLSDGGSDAFADREDPARRSAQ